MEKRFESQWAPVLALLAPGLSNHAIGDRLGIAASTVKTYVAAILEKLDAATRAEAVAIAPKILGGTSRRARTAYPLLRVEPHPAERRAHRLPLIRVGDGLDQSSLGRMNHPSITNRLHGFVASADGGETQASPTP